jgi:hypothetical protein
VAGCKSEVEKFLKGNQKRGMKFKWKEDQGNFTKKFLVPYGNVLRNFSSSRMIPSFLPSNMDLSRALSACIKLVDFKWPFNFFQK